MLEDLDLILNKDAIITTFPVKYLISAPEDVENVYRTHARTHIPLGDTSKHVDTIFKWIGGGNQGAFIGAVVGDYGHGKTSFQVHVWNCSEERKVFSVPPFKWEKVSDIVDGVDAWIQYIIGKTHAQVAVKAKNLYESFKEKSLREQAEQIAKGTKQNADDVYLTLRAMDQSGDSRDIQQVTPERFLDYCEQVTEFVEEAGYSGLLVLLDEPEVTAKALGTAKVSQILFDIADGLRLRQGDYGVFVSMPENFLAQAQSSFASLPARLQTRNCLPRLRDIYGADFAQALWERYVQEFNLGEHGQGVVTSETLQAIGQVASSDRSDLSYGPRTVVSAFRRMVYCYKEKSTAYSPDEFVRDCLEGEIYVSDYPSRIHQILESPDAEGVDPKTLMTIAAFPNGLTLEVGTKLGIDKHLLELSRRPSLVYKRGNLFGLTRLQKTIVGIERDELRDVIMNIAEEFAPDPVSQAAAINAFIHYLVPSVFEPRQGQQLLGWDIPGLWREAQDKTRYAELAGAFRQTARDYPKRTVTVAAGLLEADPQKLYSEIMSPDSNSDILIHFRIRWNKEDIMPEKRIEIDPGEPGGQPGVVKFVLDFTDTPLTNEFLEEIIERDLLTPLGILYLINEKDKRTLQRDYEAQWQVRKEQLLRELLSRFFGDQTVRTQAAEQIGQTISGDALALLGSICRAILLRRYPNYSTLISQPQWERKVNEYIGALKNADIPMGCKRGHETWAAPGDRVAKVFNTSLMNLTGGFFAGLENLISIRSLGRHDNVEVDFKLHPLEKAIVERITIDNPLPKRKFDGVECWCIPLEDVKSMILYSGYLLEELQQIVEIGRSRGSFELGEYKGERVLYCKPLDLDQMKNQLKEKLMDLEREAVEFRKLHGFHSSFDYEAIRGDIDKIEDEAHYDALLSKMNREFEKMHDRLPNYFEQLGNAISTLQGSANDVKRGLMESREVGTIKSSQKASSKWCADLNTYVLGSLRDLVKQVENECSSILTELNKASMEYSASKPGRPLDKVELLLQGWNRESELRQLLDSTKAKASTTLTSLRDYDKWIQLLSKSDEVHSGLIELKKESAHEAKASEFFLQLEAIWQSISVHLKNRSVTGLGSHKQFYEQLEKLNEERRKYISGLRSAFEEKKGRINELLQELDLGQDYRCKEAFNPDDIQGCYSRLHEEAAGHIVEAVSVERGQIDSQRQELLYARDILSRLSQDETEQLVAQLDDYNQTLDTILEKVSVDQILQLMEGPQKERMSVRDALQRSREAIRSARMAVRQAEGVEEEKLSPDAEKMLQMIPADATENLKQLILGMMKSGQGSSEALDASLNCLAELFRKGKIRITVERHQR
jgi:hypothetical protein